MPANERKLKYFLLLRIYRHFSLFLLLNSTQLTNRYPHLFILLLGSLISLIKLGLLFNGLLLKLVEALDQLGHVLALERHRKASVLQLLVARVVKNAAEGIYQRASPIVSFILLAAWGLCHIVAVKKAFVVQDYRESQAVDCLERFDIQCGNQLLFEPSSWWWWVCEAGLAVYGSCSSSCFFSVFDLDEVFTWELLVLHEREDKVFPLHGRFFLSLLCIGWG